MGNWRLKPSPGAQKKVNVTEMSATTTVLWSSSCYEIVQTPSRATEVIKMMKIRITEPKRVNRMGR